MLKNINPFQKHYSDPLLLIDEYDEPLPVGVEVACYVIKRIMQVMTVCFVIWSVLHTVASQ